MRTLALLLATIMLALSGAGPSKAAPKPTPAAIRAEIARAGARAVVNRLWDSERWDAVEDSIARGEGAWIALAPALAPGTDAGASEGLGISLAFALPKNPAAVLAVLESGDDSIIGVKRVCSMPFLEPTDAFLGRYGPKAIKAVSGVRSTALTAVRDACLAELRSAMAGAGPDISVSPIRVWPSMTLSCTSLRPAAPSLVEAKRIAATVPRVNADLLRTDRIRPEIEDRGSYWDVHWPPHPDEKLDSKKVIVTFGGFSFHIDKCSGSVSDFHAWR